MLLFPTLCTHINYRVIGPPGNYIISKTLFQADGGLLEKIYKNNMNGLYSFLKAEAGLEHLLNGDRVALISHAHLVHPIEKSHCKVNILPT